MTSSLILCKQQDNIFSIQLNREEKKNAITRPMYLDLTQAMLEAENNDNIHVVVITGGDNCFTAGNDLTDFVNAKEMEDLRPVLEFLNLLPKLKKPLIAAVNGLAIGLGTTLLLHCDMVIADQNSEFQLPFINLATCPEAASSLLLPRLVGHQKASELLLLGERFDVETALNLRLVNEIAPVRSAFTVAMKKAAMIAQKSPRAVQLTKLMLKQPILDQMSATINKEAKSFFECLQSKESKMAIQAFFNNK